VRDRVDIDGATSQPRHRGRLVEIDARLGSVGELRDRIELVTVVLSPQLREHPGGELVAEAAPVHEQDEADHRGSGGGSIWASPSRNRTPSRIDAA
jgi:hypothetical protein